jgi:hypothetical protein
MRWADHVACMEEMRNAYKFLVEKPEWKRSVGGICTDVVRMFLRKIGC